MKIFVIKMVPEYKHADYENINKSDFFILFFILKMIIFFIYFLF